MAGEAPEDGDAQDPDEAGNDSQRKQARLQAEARHQPPAMRGMITISSAVRSNVSIRSAGWPGASLKALAPLARSCVKIRSASAIAARASSSPASTSGRPHVTRRSPREESTYSVATSISFRL